MEKRSAIFLRRTVATAAFAVLTAYGFAATATSLDYCSRLGGPNVCNEGGINKVRVQTTAEILVDNT